MKKVVITLFLTAFLAFFIGAQATQQTQPQPKPEDILKNLVLVEKPQPVPDKMKAGFESITAKDSMAMLSYIASDLMEGRETATRGYQLAAEYAVSLFTIWKLKPAGDARSFQAFGRAAIMAMPREGQSIPPAEKSYLQELALKEITDPSAQMTLEIRKGDSVKVKTFLSGLDYTSMSSTPETITAPVVFASYGISEKEIGWDDFKNLDIKGKVVLIISEAPGKDDPKSPFQKKELKEKYFPAPGPMMRRFGEGFNKTREIAKLGPAAILQVGNTTKDADIFKSMAGQRPVSDDRPIIKKPRRRLMIPGEAATMPWESSPVITVTREIANAILGGAEVKIEDLQQKIETTMKPASMALPGTKLTISTTVKAALVRSANVLAYIEGSDPELKNEVVVVGAHLDHLGKWEDYVFNGADDNGSGSVGVLNIARGLALNPEKPKRTVVFALWTGEELGLLGSRYYVKNPTFPLAKTVAYLNMDMISRPYDEQSISRIARMLNVPVNDEFLKKIKPANFLPVSFSAGAGLADIIRAANQHIGLDVFLRETPSQEGRGMGGSDHSSFAAEKIPWAFSIAAMTQDYHQTSDSVEKVSGDLIQKVSRLMYVTAFSLADK